MDNSESFFIKRNKLDGMLIDTQRLLKAHTGNDKSELAEKINHIDDLSAECSSEFKKLVKIFKDNENDADVAPIIQEKLATSETKMDELIKQIEDLQKQINDALIAAKNAKDKELAKTERQIRQGFQATERLLDQVKSSDNTDSPEVNIKVETAKADETKTEAKEEPAKEEDKPDPEAKAEEDEVKNETKPDSDDSTATPVEAKQEQPKVEDCKPEDVQQSICCDPESTEVAVSEATKTEDERPFWSIIITIFVGLMTTLTWHNHDFNEAKLINEESRLILANHANSVWAAWIAGFTVAACFWLVLVAIGYFRSYLAKPKSDNATTEKEKK